MGAQNAKLLSNDFEPELSWPLEPANDSIVLSPEPFGGALRSNTRAEARGSKWMRQTGLFAIVVVAGASVAAVMAMGQFGMPASRTSTVALPLNATADTFWTGAERPTVERSDVVASADLAVGLDTLRAQMQSANATEPAVVPNSRFATADEPAPSWRAEPVAVSATPLPIPSSSFSSENAPKQADRTAAEVTAVLERARDLIGVGDIVSARRLAEYAAIGGDGRALFILAETFDPAQLARWRVRGIRADVEKARALYQQAMSRGVTEARERSARLP